MENKTNITKEETEAKNRESLLNQLLDDRCELYGVRNTICYLFDFGLTRDEIIALKFDANDVDDVQEHPDADYDCK